MATITVYRRVRQIVKVGAKLSSGGVGGVTDHGALTGLADDDHPQYHNNARGDARYSQLGHTHTKSEVGLSNVDNTSDANKPVSTAQAAALANKADLVAGKVPASQLPAYVDDVEEYANVAAFPVTGESGKIYVALDVNLTYRWSGTVYVEISPSLALGETSSTAYRGDRGKAAYDHSLVTGNPHGTTKSDVGLGNADNTADINKPMSTPQQRQSIINAIIFG